MLILRKTGMNALRMETVTWGEKNPNLEVKLTAWLAIHTSHQALSEKAITL